MVWRRSLPSRGLASSRCPQPRRSSPGCSAAALASELFAGKSHVFCPRARPRSRGTAEGRRALSAIRGYQPLDFRDDLEQVPDQADIRHLENRRLAVLVDGDDGARVLDAGEVLDGARDADRYIQLRRNDFAGLPDLHLVGRIAGVDGRTGSANRSAELVRKAVENLEALGAAQRPP